LSIGQLLIGRFFFLHESQAVQGIDRAEKSFEFLHATFGEYLVARIIVASLVDLAAERLHQSRRPQAGALDAGYFYATTSFATIGRRAPVREFCEALLARLDPQRRRQCRELILELLADAWFPHPTWSYTGHEPRRLPTPARHAAYSANLVLLLVLLADGPVDVADALGEPVLDHWRRHALLWQSQLAAEDWDGMWQNLRVTWRRTDPAKPMRLTLACEDGSDVSVYAALPWPEAEGISEPQSYTMFPDLAVPATSRFGLTLRFASFTQIGDELRVLFHRTIPFERLFAGRDWHWTPNNGASVEAGRVYGDLLLEPVSAKTPDQWGTIYRTVLSDTSSTPGEFRTALRALGAAVGELPSWLVADLLAVAISNDADGVAVRNGWPDTLAALAARVGPDTEHVRRLLHLLWRTSPAQEIATLETQMAVAFRRVGLRAPRINASSEEDEERSASPRR
jgi:hypothetical protein